MAAITQITHCTPVRRGAVAVRGGWGMNQIVSTRAPDLIESGELMKPATKEGKRPMVWIMFAIGAALCWGVYGPALHKGQTLLGNPLKALFCVGVAYMLIGVLVPILGLGGIKIGRASCRERV